MDSTKNGNGPMITDGPHFVERAPINHPPVEAQQAAHGQSLGKTLHLTFRLNKATPGALQYREIVPDNEPPKVGTIYIKKYMVTQPYPDMVSMDLHIPLGVDAAGRS